MTPNDRNISVTNENRLGTRDRPDRTPQNTQSITAILNESRLPYRYHATMTHKTEGQGVEMIFLPKFTNASG
jgi:hypothetical protein